MQAVILSVAKDLQGGQVPPGARQTSRGRCIAPTADLSAIATFPIIPIQLLFTIIKSALNREGGYMIIQTVKFKSALSEADIQRVMEERAPQFRALPGLLQKYYLRDNQTGEVGAVYIWDTEESLRAYRQSDLARTIASAYKAVEQPRVEIFETILTLRPEKLP
jgi:heme-degrading monooxygenase HmoA